MRTVTIRLAPVLPTRVAVVQFPDVEHATRASTEALNYGVNLRTFFLRFPYARADVQQ